ncbi:transposon Tf2-8 polyprotein [Trichonephila clavipes]|uniref:RNA-directed DNA polymerase n=1 Tax=Trichonephila clavipes TaxID=2585209 RepID=A0A8X6RNR2_TRICX|nr:transposon Tf2-8 polyprotein [Trichonephila clavipes]
MANWSQCEEFPKRKPRKGETVRNRNTITENSKPSKPVTPNLSFAAALSGASNKNSIPGTSATPEETPSTNEKNNENDFGFKDAINELRRFLIDYPFLLEMDVDEASRKYTAFVTETGQYEFLKVPFGLSISSNYFQRYINYVFRELLRDGTLIIYLDDIIPATDEKEAYKKISSCEGAKLELHTDACKLGLGAVLLQQGEDGRFYPIHYMSKKTSIQEEKLCSYELEVLAVIEALKKFRNYLLGRKFRIQTDCAAFAKTLDKKELTPKRARWSIFLTDFDYEIVNAQESDEYIRTIKKLLQEGKTSEFIVSNKISYKISEDQELLVVPEMMKVDVIKKAHSFGHFAATKTEELVKRDYYFPNMRRCIENVKNCVECILVNKKRGKGEGFLNPIPKDLPLSTYQGDFIGPLPTTNKNYNHLFTVIDAFTKFTWLYPTKSTTAQEAIERLKLQQKTFGNPSRVINDKGGAFKSKEFEDYCADEQITTGVPRGNGQ